jgi:hypothetical protein
LRRRNLCAKVRSRESACDSCRSEAPQTHPLRSGRDRPRPAPKEQPPRNLSGKRTTAQQNLESVRWTKRASRLRQRAADGITLSGNVTDGALEIVTTAFGATHVANDHQFHAYGRPHAVGGAAAR